MIYSDLYLKNKKGIPTSIGLILVVTITFLLAQLFFVQRVPARADPNITASVKIGNLSSSQATIFFQTTQKERSWIIYGLNKDKLETIAMDPRDQGKPTGRLNHYIELKNLEPQTTYFYKIVSDDALIGDSNGSAFRFKTTQANLQTSATNPAYGKVLTRGREPVIGAIVQLDNPQITPRFALTKAGGDFVIPLSQLIDPETNRIKALAADDNLTITIFADEETSIITTKTTNISPLPNAIIVGENYDFTEEEQVLSATTAGQEGEQKLGIVFPKQHAIIPSSNPLIKGRAHPNSSVTLTLRGQKVSFASTIRSSPDGIWQLDYSDQLPVGNYTLLFSSKTQEGRTVQDSREFSIAKSGENVLQAATPEASPTRNPSPTPTTQEQQSEPTPTISTPINTPTPTISTPINTPTPLSEPSIASPSPTMAPPPPTASTTIPALISSASLIIIGIGILLFAF